MARLLFFVVMRINDNRNVQFGCQDLELALGPYTEAASSRSLPIVAFVIKLADKGYSGACRPTFAAAVRSLITAPFSLPIRFPYPYIRL